MQIERRALYNSIRMNWLWNPSLQSKSWQVEDYRSIPTETLFQRLKDLHVSLDKQSLLALIDSTESPEDLSDELVDDLGLENEGQDQVYLLIFELWRRLTPEKQSISLFCDELDHQIYLFDNGLSTNGEDIQDAIANLEVILDENSDNGVDPVTAFETISTGCANDLEPFLYDYISEQIDNGNISYASELIEDFHEYASDSKWFEFLRAQVIATTDPKASNDIIRTLIKKISKNPDFEFAIEMFAFLSQSGEHDVFQSLLKSSIPLASTEEDFHEILTLSADYFARLDRDKEEQQIQGIIQSRQHFLPEAKFHPKDPQVTELLKISEAK